MSLLAALLIAAAIIALVAAAGGIVGRRLARLRLAESGWYRVWNSEGRERWAHKQLTAGRPCSRGEALLRQDIEDERSIGA